VLGWHSAKIKLSMDIDSAKIDFLDYFGKSCTIYLIFLLKAAYFKNKISPTQ
jgi:hypothetical protein